MKTTVDSAGRLVIPKSIREQAGIAAGAEVEVRHRDGRIEIEPASAAMRLQRDGRRARIETDEALDALSILAVRDVLERVRR